MAAVSWSKKSRGPRARRWVRRPSSYRPWGNCARLAFDDLLSDKTEVFLLNMRELGLKLAGRGE